MTTFYTYPEPGPSWWNRRQADTPAISVLPNLQALPGRVEELRRSGVALVLIDTPPAITNAIRGAMQVANLVAMPVRPSPHDLDAIGATIDLAHQAKAEFVFVLTQAKLHARVTPQAVALLSAHGTVASSIIQDRVIYASAMIDGRTAVDIDPKGAAAVEVFELWRFLQERMKDGQKGREKESCLVQSLRTWRRI